MQLLEVSGAVRPLEWSLGVKALMVSADPSTWTEILKENTLCN